MSHPAAAPDDSTLRLERLSEAAREVLRLAAARGASQADVILNDDSGLSVNVRLGEVETVERNTAATASSFSTSPSMRSKPCGGSSTGRSCTAPTQSRPMAANKSNVSSEPEE